MVRILGLCLPAGYAAERHLDHITVLLRGRRVGCLAHDSAPLELQAQVNNDHRGRPGDLPRVGSVAVPGVRALTEVLS